MLVWLCGTAAAQDVALWGYHVSQWHKFLEKECQVTADLPTPGPDGQVHAKPFRTTN